MRRSPLMTFSLGVLAGVAWGRRRFGPAAQRAPAPRPSAQAAEPAPAEPPSPESPHAGAERASVLGYERSSPASPDPAAGQASGAPGHRILNG